MPEMTQQTETDIDNSMFEAMCGALRSALWRRMPHGWSLVMYLIPKLPVYRQIVQAPGQSEDTAASGQSAARIHARRVLATFESVLRGPVAAALQAVGPYNSFRLPFVVISASRLVSRLAEQLGCRTKDVIDTTRIPMHFDAISAKCINSIANSRSILATCGLEATRSLWDYVVAVRDQTGQDVKKIRFLQKDNTICVEWLTDNDTLVKTDSAQCFLESISRSVTQELHRYHESIESLRNKYQQMADSTIREVSPRLAQAVHLALQRDRCVGIRLFKLRTRRNIPMDIWLFIDPTPQAQGACTISVHRAHSEFVLAAKDGTRFYFPPCLLTARIVFADGAPQVTSPIIRQPRGGHVWCHPYTGSLGPDPFAKAILDGDETDLMYECSEQALRFFPNLAPRAAGAREMNLCIEGQSSLMAELRKELNKGLACLDALDVLGIVTSLHDFARLGLTRGHQNNMAGPRVQLAANAMPYPLRSQNLCGKLAERIFTYDPLADASVTVRKFRRC